MKDTEIYGGDVTVNLPIDEIENEHQTLISLVLDESGSMDGFISTMRDSLTNFKSALQNSKQQDEMLISKLTFSDSVDAIGGYQLVDDLNLDYKASGTTALYDAIIKAKNQLINNGSGYMEQLISNGIKTKAIVVIFSDGEDNNSRALASDARRAVDELKRKEIIVAFVAFGNNSHGVANDLGIDSQNVMEVDATESELRRIFAVLSKSAISASKSAAAGQSNNNFFV